MKRSNLLLVTFMVSTLSSLSLAFSAEQLTEEQVKELALEAILENPDIIRQAISKLEEIERKKQQSAVSKVLASRWNELAGDENAPVLGNPDGDVTLVEFFDYNCPYCRRVKPEINQLLEKDSSVRLVYREWPILGEGSVFAAQAALASRNQGKYEEFHWALMGINGQANEASVLQTAKKHGLDIERLRRDMERPEITQHIQMSMELARQLGITGTPSFVVQDAVLPGLVTADRLISEVSRVRKQAEN